MGVLCANELDTRKLQRRFSQGLFTESGEGGQLTLASRCVVHSRYMNTRKVQRIFH